MGYSSQVSIISFQFLSAHIFLTKIYKEKLIFVRNGFTLSTVEDMHNQEYYVVDFIFFEKKDQNRDRSAKTFFNVIFIHIYILFFDD